MKELYISSPVPIVLYYNQSVVAIAHNPNFYSSTKHMEVDGFLCSWSSVIQTTWSLSYF